MAFADDVERGINTLETWLGERLPRATVSYVGMTRDDFHRWIADFGPGEPGLRLGALERVLADHDLLSARIAQLDRGGWLDGVDEQDKWVLLTAVGVVNKSREDW